MSSVDDLFTEAEAAALIGKSTDTVRRWAKKGVLTAVTKGSERFYIFPPEVRARYTLRPALLGEPSALVVNLLAALDRQQQLNATTLEVLGSLNERIASIERYIEKVSPTTPPETT